MTFHNSASFCYKCLLSLNSIQLHRRKKVTLLQKTCCNMMRYTSKWEICVIKYCEIFHKLNVSATEIRLVQYLQMSCLKLVAVERHVSILKLSRSGARSTPAADTGLASCLARPDVMMHFFSFWYGK